MFEIHSESVNGKIYVDELLEKQIKKLDPNRQHVDGVDGCLRCVDINKSDVGVNVYGESTCVDGSLRRVDVNRSDVDVNTLIVTLQSTVNTLKHQLTVKDNQSTELTSMLKASQEQQSTLVVALSAAQALHAGTIKERLTDRFEDSEEQEDTVVDASGEKKKKKNFFAKIFRRN